MALDRLCIMERLRGSGVSMDACLQVDAVRVCTAPGGRAVGPAGRRVCTAAGTTLMQERGMHGSGSDPGTAPQGSRRPAKLESSRQRGCSRTGGLAVRPRCAAGRDDASPRGIAVGSTAGPQAAVGPFSCGGGRGKDLEVAAELNGRPRQTFNRREPIEVLD
jgi:hypothetical protein